MIKDGKEAVGMFAEVQFQNNFQKIFLKEFLFWKIVGHSLQFNHKRDLFMGLLLQGS